MKSGREKILNLQHLLQEKYGSAQAPAFSLVQEPSRTSSDISFPREIRPGTVCEIVAGPASSGVGLAIENLLESDFKRKGNHLALIDGRDSFDPNLSGNSLSRLLWLRCRHAKDVMKSADWLLRDGNLSLVIIDLQLNPYQETRRVPASSWYRLRALAEETDTALFVFSSEKLLPCAHTRLVLQKRFPISILDESREKIPVVFVTEKSHSQTAGKVKGLIARTG